MHLTTLNGKLRLNKCGGVLVEAESEEEPCCCCCLTGDGKGTIFLAGVGGDTCWGVSGNAHLYFTKCRAGAMELHGLGVIGQVSTSAIESNVTYDGKAVKIETGSGCQINYATVRTSSMDCVNISSVGTRNSGSGLGWTNSPGVVAGETTCNSNRPGTVGGQGAYKLTISNVASDGDYIVHVQIGCSTGPFFSSAPGGKSGTYFYVAGDNQNINSTLNGRPALTCGSGSMIESNVVPNLGTTANWSIPGDCIIWLVIGWVVPFE